MKKQVLLILSFLFSYNLWSQPWLIPDQEIKTTRRNNINTFQYKQKAFNEYWKDKPITKGSGYKPFRRWENFMAPRVDSLGNINSTAYWRALQEAGSEESDVAWSFLVPSNTPYTQTSGELSGNGRLNCVAFHPTSEDTIYVGAPSGGLWMTADGGLSWETTTDKLGSLGVSAIAINPDNPLNIFIATGDGDADDTYGVGILKSDDGGKTWQTTGLSIEQYSRLSFGRIIMDDSNPDIMLATGSGGVYRTDDSWQTYTKVITGNFKDIEFQPGNFSVILVSKYGYDGAASVYKSTDGGETFAESATGLNPGNTINRIELAVTPASTNIVYALCSDVDTNSFEALYMSEDMGDSWTVVYNGPKNLLSSDIWGVLDNGQGWYDLALAVSPEDKNVVYVGGVNIWKSEDGGSSWSLNAHWTYSSDRDYVHADHHALSFSPVNGKLYSANDGGLYVTSDGGENWLNKSNGLEITQFYKLGLSASADNKILAGTQDNGTMLYDNGTWKEIFNGDGMECVIAPNNSDVMYVEYYYGDIYRSVNGGSTFWPIIPDYTLSGKWVTPFTINPHNPNMLVIGYSDIYMSENMGDDWVNLTNGLERTVSESDLNMVDIEFSTSHPGYMYANSTYNIWKTNNLGESWTNITTGLPKQKITSIAISDNNPNELWISLSTFNSEDKVYYSNDGGASWTNYSTGLPKVPVNDLLVRKNSNNEIFAGTDVGVFHINNDLSSWENFNGTLPNVVVMELEIDDNNSTLYAATHGRGLWHTELDSPVNPSFGFISEIVNACVGGSVKLFNTGDATYDSLGWITDGGTIQSQNHDTSYVSWNTSGYKTIQLLYYTKGLADTLIKKDYIKVSNELDFSVYLLNEQDLCSGGNIQIKTTSDYDFDISPDEGLTYLTDGIYEWQPSTTTKYRFTATHAGCSLYKYVSINYSPDDVCDAICLQVGVNGPFDNNCATVQSGEAIPEGGTCNSINGYCCYFQDTWCGNELELDNTAWFKIVVPESGNVTVWTYGMDTQIALYSAANCNGLLNDNYEILAANDDYLALDNYASAIEQLSGLTPGDTLYLQVDGSYGGVTGSFYVHVDESFNPTYRSNVIYNNVDPKLYPNPSKDQFTVEIKLSKSSALGIEVFNSSGQKVDSRYITEQNCVYSEVFNHNFPKGIYLVVISLDKKQYIKKLVVE